MSELRRLIADWHHAADQMDRAAERRRAAGDVHGLADMDRLWSIAAAYRCCAVELGRVVELAEEVA